MYRTAFAAVTTNTGVSLCVSYSYEDDLLTLVATPGTFYCINYVAQTNY